MESENSMQQDCKSLKIVWLEGPCKNVLIEYESEKSEILIGRKDSAASVSPDLNLSDDPKVAFMHAWLRRKKSLWYIEGIGDCDIWVDGKNIKCEETINPGAVIKIGDTVFTAIPCNWLIVCYNRVLVYGPYIKTINYMFFHCGLRLMNTLHLKNLGNENSVPFNITIQIDNYSMPCNLEVPSLEPMETRNIQPPAFRLLFDRLKGVVGRETVKLRASIANAEVSCFTGNLTLLSTLDWGFKLFRPETISAYILPRNPIIQGIVLEAQENFRINFRQLINESTEDEKGEARKKVIATLYNYLKDVRSIYYENPYITDNFQKIKLPHNIFYPDRNNLLGKGTCIDLTLLMAGCLENVGLNPLIIFAGNENGVPIHAFLGCWKGNGRNFRTAVEEKDMRDVLMLECTGIAEAVEGGETKMSFTRSVDLAENNYRSSSWKYMLDVSRTRKMPVNIKPLDLESEPTVFNIYSEAEKFAETKGHRQVESAHLLYGVLKTGGEVTRKVFESCGQDYGEVSKRLESTIKQGNYRGVLVYTNSYRNFQDIAREIAGRSQSLTVREQDVLYALLRNYTISGTLGKLCEILSLDMKTLLLAFNKLYSKPGNSTMFD